MHISLYFWVENCEKASQKRGVEGMSEINSALTVKLWGARQIGKRERNKTKENSRLSECLFINIIIMNSSTTFWKTSDLLLAPCEHWRHRDLRNWNFRADFGRRIREKKMPHFSLTIRQFSLTVIVTEWSIILHWFRFFWSPSIYFSSLSAFFLLVCFRGCCNAHILVEHAT